MRNVDQFLTSRKRPWKHLNTSAERGGQICLEQEATLPLACVCKHHLYIQTCLILCIVSPMPIPEVPSNYSVTVEGVANPVRWIMGGRLWCHSWELEFFLEIISRWSDLAELCTQHVRLSLQLCIYFASWYYSLIPQNCMLLILGDKLF